MKKIEVNNITFGYTKEKKVLEALSFGIAENEKIGIIGANGVGKSTLLKLMIGLETPQSGELLVDGEALVKKNLPKLRQTIGYVFQDSESQLFMGTVEEDVAFAPRNYGYSPKEVELLCSQALEHCGITHLRQRRIYQLSGGEKKLAAIATVLAMQPEVILMDEPSAALDPANRERLIEVVKNLSSSVVIASHDLDFIYDVCDRVMILAEGKIAYVGETKEVLTNAALLEQNGLRIPLSFRFMEV